MSEVEAKVDTIGQACPVPVLLTQRGLKGIRSGAILEVIGDFFPAKKNIQDYAEKHGHEVIEVIEPDEIGIYKIYIRKG
ncbi:MAG: sulfurtransferase TusA family protein [Candidatus Lokiarchaeota archaeon]|nr:sulfurtransferase TusA family protein [Candidatus Lokiarchaeota archaeon]